MSRMSDLATNDPNLRMYFGLYINRNMFRLGCKKSRFHRGVTGVLYRTGVQTLVACLPASSAAASQHETHCMIRAYRDLNVKMTWGKCALPASIFLAFPDI